MNSGCAEVVNAQVGAAPFLIRHGENGLVYPDGSEEAMEKQVRYLLDHPAEGSRMGREAYHTIVSAWNPETATKRLVEFYEQFCRGQINPPQSGPFSPAPVISPGKMYADMMEKGRKLIDGQ
jgi:glycosyltransferase involved in cell wall biosynthesis